MESTDAVAALSALAQESRLEVFRLLVQAGPEGMSAGDIGARLKLPATTLSFHLNQLRQARLAAFKRKGRSLIYAADFAAMNQLIAYLAESCCRGNPQDCGVNIKKCDPAAPANTKEAT